MSLAEKFQITVPYSETAGETDGEEWASAESARTNEGNRPPGEGEKFNCLPETDIDDRRSEFAHGFGGDTDVTADVEPASLEKGYRRRQLNATDDQYGGEHIDLFYGEAVDEKGEAGFVERNNYLDRI